MVYWLIILAILAVSANFSWPFSSLQTWVNSKHLVHPHVPPQAYVALASGSEPKRICWGHFWSGLVAHTFLHIKFEQSLSFYCIPTYLHGQMLHMPVALNPKEMLGNMSAVVLIPTFPWSPSLSTLWPSSASPCTCTGRCSTSQWPWSKRRCWVTCLQWSWYPPFPTHQVWALYDHLCHLHRFGDFEFCRPSDFQGPQYPQYPQDTI